MSTKEDKASQAFYPIASEGISQSQLLGRQGRMQEALSALLVLEKQARLAADVDNTCRIVTAIVDLCYEHKEWRLLNENILLIAKRRSQLKQAVTKTVQAASALIEKTPDLKTKLDLIETLRTVSEGKIHVEVERAQITRLLAKMKEEDGKIQEAATILQEVQVETYGMMSKRDKTDYILEQARLCLDCSDFLRAFIILKKINPKVFALVEEKKDAGPAKKVQADMMDVDTSPATDLSDLKIRYFQLYIRYYLKHDDYMQVARSFLAIYDTPSVLQDEGQWKNVLMSAIVFLFLSPHGTETSDFLNRMAKEKRVEDDLPGFKSLILKAMRNELVDWPVFRDECLSLFSSVDLFVANSDKYMKVLLDCTADHNIRVLSKYYTTITLRRMEELLDLSAEDTESYLSKLVASKSLFAKIDRVAGQVTFVPPRDASETLNAWAHNISDVLNLVERTCHIVNKELMLHKSSNAALTADN